MRLWEKHAERAYEYDFQAEAETDPAKRHELQLRAQARLELAQLEWERDVKRGRLATPPADFYSDRFGDVYARR